MSRTLERNRIAIVASLSSAIVAAALTAILVSSDAGAATTCPSGSSITLQNIPCAIHGFKDASVSLSNGTSFQTVASLPLPPGKYVVSANLEVQLTGNVDFLPQNLDCRLAVGSDSDQETASFEASDISRVLALSTAHTFTSGGHSVLACNTNGLNGFSTRRMRITAIRLGTLNKVAMP
ncbi:MAG: hypothetical protein M3P43_00720 [Actinomycetota bacterium]|nr:hypothetical protein [Actinomycetota bacterium]